METLRQYINLCVGNTDRCGSKSNILDKLWCKNDKKTHILIYCSGGGGVRCGCKYNKREKYPCGLSKWDFNIMRHLSEFEVNG